MATNVTVEKFDQLEAAQKALPGTNFVLDHLGKTNFAPEDGYAAAAPLWKLAKYPNLHLKVATRNFWEENELQTQFPKLVAQFGADRMAWGSNYPASDGTLPELVAVAQKGLATLSDAERAMVMGGPALKLYPALAGKVAA